LLGSCEPKQTHQRPCVDLYASERQRQSGWKLRTKNQVAAVRHHPNITLSETQHHPVGSPPMQASSSGRLSQAQHLPVCCLL
jgi:hypothetical protein